MQTLSLEQTQNVHGATGAHTMTAFTPPSPGSPPPARVTPGGSGHLLPH